MKFFTKFMYVVLKTIVSVFINKCVLCKNCKKNHAFGPSWNNTSKNFFVIVRLH